MPSLTIHLLAAYKYDPNGSAEFFAGSLAPDAVRDRADKDRTHLRDIPVSARLPALHALACRLGISHGDMTHGDMTHKDMLRNINLGALLHLYTDYMWDTTLQKRYIDSFGDGWFLPYREQIAVAGAWIYHNMPEIRRVWKLVFEAANAGLKIDVGAITCASIRGECKKKCGIECGDARGLILRNYKWNIENYFGASAAFPPDEVIRFAADTAASFQLFLRG